MIRFKSVVLPAPLAPISATRSPARMCRSIFENSVRPPKDFSSPVAMITSSPVLRRAVKEKRTFWSDTGFSIFSIFSSRFSRLSAARMDFSRLYMR